MTEDCSRKEVLGIGVSGDLSGCAPRRRANFSLFCEVAVRAGWRQRVCK